MLISLAGYGQAMFKLGQGTEFAHVYKTTGAGQDLYLVEITSQSEYKLHRYDGYDYTDLGTISVLPKHNISTAEGFRILDMTYFENKLYVMGTEFGPNKSTTPNKVVVFDGTNWNDITNTNITEAYQLNSFVSYGNKLHIVGIFKNSGLMYLDNTDWMPAGDVLGSNKVLDYVIDAEVYLGKIYATGEFTRPITAQRYNTAVYQNGSWSPISTPPFIERSRYFTKINNKLVLCGEANVQFDYLKSFDGAGWDDISQGLEDFDAQEFWGLAGTENLLCATGVFVNRKTGVQFNFLMRDTKGWHFGENTFTNNRISLAQNGNDIYAYGDFGFTGISGIGEMTYNSSMISGKVYVDLDNSCTQEPNEKGLGTTKLILNPGNHVFYTNTDGTYQIPVKPGAYTVSFEPPVKYGFGCGKLVSVNVDKQINYQVPDMNVVVLPDVVDLELNSRLLNGYTLLKNKYNEIELLARNNGSVTIDGATLTLKMGDWWKDVVITPTPIQMEEGTYQWNLTNLGEDEQFVIKISGTIKSDLPLHTDFCFTGEVTAPQVDVDGVSNREAVDFTAGEDLDPISKQVSCGKWYAVTDNDISYQIRIANESNSVVNKVTVVDTFDSDLVSNYITDLTDLGSSTKTSFKQIKVPGRDEWRMIYTWTSIDANLSATGATDGSDVGFATIKFKLHDYSKQKGIVLCNTARVYLENYEPQFTNTVCSQATNVGIDPVVKFKSGVILFPNPASDELTIKNGSTEKRTITVMSQTGQILYETEVQSLDNAKLDLRAWVSGIYFVQVRGFETQKLIIH